MGEFAFAAAAPPSLPLAGSARRFPVRRIWCIGRNYADHVREMATPAGQEAAVFFAKPADALVSDGADVRYPPATGDLQYEVELVVAIGREARAIDAARALECVYAYAVGNDLTRRDLQREAKRLASPWDLAKAFDDSAPVGALVPASECGHPSSGRIWLKLNGELRQDGDLGDMLLGVPQILATLSRHVALQPGDLVFTGTPAGVGRLAVGDRIEAGVAGLPALAHSIIAPAG